MGRPVYPYELSDPDYTWLVNSYQENNPQSTCFECGYMPVVFFVKEGNEVSDFFDDEFFFQPDEKDFESIEFDKK